MLVRDALLRPPINANRRERSEIVAARARSFRTSAHAPRITSRGGASRRYPEITLSFLKTRHLFAALSLTAAVPAQRLAAQDTLARRLPPVVTVTREGGRSLLDLPFAISEVVPDSTRPGQTHTLLDQTLFLLPGVTLANRTNPSQDPRISIRGYGARSAFGVRSIKVLRDGMPLTLPDGQTPVDYLDLESVGRVEVIRGSASALYGNAGGGVIDLRSTPPPEQPISAQIRSW